MSVRSFLIVGAALIFVGCSGSASGSTRTGGDVEASAAEELEGISKDVEQRLTKVLAPVDECEALVKDIGTMQERLGPAFATGFSTAVQGGTFEGEAGATIDAATQNELKALAQRVLQVVAALKAAPEEAAALASDVAAALPRIPELVARGTASTQVTLNNPFASAEEKATAQAEAQKLEAAPTAIVALLQNAQQQLVTLPPRAVAALESLVSASALDANTLAVAAATATPTASISETTVDRPSMGSEHEPTISPHEALGRIGPWIGAAVATGRARLKRAEATRQALASSLNGVVPDPKRGIDRAWFARGVNAAMLGQPVPPLLDQQPAPSDITEQIKHFAQNTLTSLAELAAMQREMSKVRETIDETRAALPAIVKAADLWTDQALADFGADESYKQRARARKDEIPVLQMEILIAIQLARAEIAEWPEQTRATIAAIGAELKPVDGDLLALAKEVPTTRLLEPMPEIDGPPPSRPAPQVATPLPLQDAQPRVAQEDSVIWPFALAAGLTVGALVAGIYSVDRIAAFNDCVNKASGYGCTNTTSLDNQATAGTAATAVLASGALVSLILGFVAQ